MEIALCYPSVLPGRGGCETYIADLSRKLAAEGHAVHLLAAQWDVSALPAGTHYHRLPTPSGPRWLRPWRFAKACEEALAKLRPDVSLGFDKTWGQDILYPQGGLHVATVAHNHNKSAGWAGRAFSKAMKALDPANRSYRLLERKQYFCEKRPLIVVNSQMVRRHFEEYYGVVPDNVRVLYSAIDPARFVAEDRFKLRFDERKAWRVDPEEPVGLFLAMNYRLKGLEPLLKALPHSKRTMLAVAGHPKFGKYQALAEKLGVADRVRFLGHRPDPRACYFAADYLVHPTFYDPCSLVALEALACGLPVLTTQYNGAAELLDGATGVVVNNPHDAAELGHALDAIREPAFLKVGSAAARATASRWTFEHHFRGLLNLMAEAQQLRAAA